MKLYCRGCNREFIVAEETETAFVERDNRNGDEQRPAGRYEHPKVDCDQIGGGNVR